MFRVGSRLSGMVAAKMSKTSEAALKDGALKSPSIRNSPAKPLLSLTLATHNRARYLERYLTHHITAFESAGLDYELIVSDNCSTDETPQILERYAQRHKRMRVTRQGSNIGAYNNIKYVLNEARGEIVLSIADDDVMVPHQLLNYVRRMDENRNLVMIQAPWFLVDETQDGAITGKFYDFDGERTFVRHDYAQCLEFIINHHVFPECWLLRTSAVQSVIGERHSFAYIFFNMLTRALGLGDVLFSPDPHIAATAIAKGDNAHVGNGELMEGWDMYRGGLEMLASYARQYQPGSMNDPGLLAHAIQSFTLQRMLVAARFHALAGKWSNTYHLQRRIHAYGGDCGLHVDHLNISRLAAMETAISECVNLGAEEIVVDDRVGQELLDFLKLPVGARVVRRADAAGDGRRTAFAMIGEATGITLGPKDFAFDLRAAMHRFPALP